MIIRRRRAGGGRKPLGKFAKSAAFTTRLEPETRRALDEAAASSGQSVSVMAETILKKGLMKPSGATHNLSLAAAAALLAKDVEGATGRNWLKDAFTAEAMHFAVGHLLLHFGAEASGTPEIPTAVTDAAQRMPPEFAARYREPSGLGQILAYRLIGEIEQAAASEAVNEFDQPIFFSNKPAQLALIGAGFGKRVADKRGRRR